MANPKESIWGAPDTWIYSPHTTYGLTSTLSKTIHADRPKVAYFGAGTTAGYEGSLLRAINVSQKMVLNEYIDNSICPCGQDPNVSPFAKIAIFNENDDLSTTPRVVTISDNINWFFADKAVTVPYNNGFEYFKQYTRQDVPNEGLKYQQFAPKANSPANGTNIDMQMCPYTYYGLRSLFLSIEVHCMPKTATNPITQTTWRTLRAWKTQYAETEDIIGLRLYVRTCQSINPSTLELTYSTDKAISEGQQSYVCITNPITIENDGTNTPTQLLSVFNKGQRSAYIFDITLQIYAWYSGNDSRTNRAILPCWNYFEGQTVHKWYGDSSDPVRYYFYKIPYSEDTYEKIMSIAALFGCFFTDRNVNVFAYDMLSEYVYLPVIDENGVAHGQYTNGSDNANNSLYSKSSIRDIDYDPEAPPTPVDPNTYSNTTGFNSLTSGASMVERYVLNDSNVRQLLSDLWTITDDLTLDAGNVDFSELSEKILDEFLVTNPIDCIVSLKRYPFNIPHTFNLNKAPLKLGKSQVTSQGYPTHNIFNTVLFSGVNIYPKFGGSFLDYAPYTEYELYVPFCGTIKLNAGDILGHTLNCRLQIDLITGVCTAYILADELVIETMTGNCACEMQITGTDTSYMAGSITGAITQAKSTKLANITTSWSPLSIGGAISTVYNPWKQAQTAISARYEREKAEYDLQHIQSPVHTMGSASPLTAWYQEFTARLIIYYPEGDAIDSSGGVSSTSPKLADLTDYAHNVGFACVMNGTVSEFHGKTVGNIDTSSIVGATEEERAQIKDLFAQGVWLP